MPLKPNARLLVAVLCLAFLPIPARAAAKKAAAHAETDVAVNLYGSFNQILSGAVSDGQTQSLANAAGGMIELRHIVHPWLGYEATYSLNRANQTSTSLTAACPNFGPCSPSNFIYPSTTVSAFAHELAGDWVFSARLANLRPFAIVGVGILLDVPVGSANNTELYCSSNPISCQYGTVPTQAARAPVFVYGAGFDWGLLPHLGLRAQLRGNLYHASELTKYYQAPASLAQTLEPMIGAYFRF